MRSRVPPADPIASSRPSPSKTSVGAIMLAIRAPGAKRLPNEIHLAEHAVQVQVEPGQPVARAEPEARRQHARVALGVDDRDVRGMSVDRRPALERIEQRVGAAGRIEPRERLRTPGEAGARQHAAAGEVARRPAPTRPRRTRRGRRRSSTPPRRRSARAGLRAIVPRVDRGRALVADELERRDESRLLQEVALGEQTRPRARTSRRLRASSSPARASRGTTRVPSASRRRRARACKAGSTSSRPRQPAVRAPERVEARREPGHGTRRCADRVVDERVAERDGQRFHRLRRDPDGTETKQSRLRTVPLAASK